MLRANLYDISKHMIVSKYYSVKSLRNILGSPAFCLLNSIPKSGTHLINGLVEEITGKNISLNEIDDLAFNGLYYTSSDLRLKLRSFKNGDPVLCHFMATEKNIGLVKEHASSHIFLYRDPRAVAVSYANWVLNEPRSYLHDLFHSVDDFDKCIEISIKGALPVQIGQALKGFAGILKIYKAYSRWLDDQNVLKVRFEDLVGKRGGGKEEKRTESIRKISELLGIPCSEQYISQKFHSETFLVDPHKSHTFFSGMGGQIDNWKKYFNDCHYDLFSNGEGENILKKFGY